MSSTDTKKTDNSVPGFSLRLNTLLDHADFPKNGERFSLGARQAHVHINTFRAWCNNDLPPRRFGDLVIFIDSLSLSHTPTQNIIGWLYSGTHDPFKPETPTTNDAEHITLLNLFLDYVLNHHREAFLALETYQREAVFLYLQTILVAHPDITTAPTDKRQPLFDALMMALQSGLI